jgi:hypothetical protein
MSRRKMVGVCFLSAFPVPKTAQFRTHHNPGSYALRTNHKLGRRKHSLRPQAYLYDNLPAPLRY